MKMRIQNENRKEKKIIWHTISTPLWSYCSYLGSEIPARKPSLDSEMYVQ